MPKCVVAISGKRKSGKDYCTKLIKEALTLKDVNVSVVGISNSLKEQFATINGLNYAELLTDGSYKEQFRKEMIEWGEKARIKDSGLFCRSAIDSVIDSDVVIVSDCRRSTDYEFFTSKYSTLTVRIEASENDRKQRGFQFVAGIDDAVSECGLDDYECDLVLYNSTGKDLQTQIDIIVLKIISLTKMN
uniref:Phosphomevalonate kinase n=1 Tax=Caenorhabditis tropicalis TaxID=1561998 RepID=A0A1I7TS76_9PELO